MVFFRGVFIPVFLGLLIVSSMVGVQAQPVSLTQPQLAGTFWSGYFWRSEQTNGMNATFTSNIEMTVQGTGTSNYWNNYGKVFKPFNHPAAQVDIALVDQPANASSAGLWLVKDSQNALIVEKHRDATNPQYNTNLFIVERINGIDHFVYISPDTPTGNFDTFRIQRIVNGYIVFYNGTLTYVGNLSLTGYNQVELAGYARASGDQLYSAFRFYGE